MQEKLNKKISITDKWFVDNGYFIITIDDRTNFTYEIYSETEKWKALSETCFRQINLSTEIVTPEMLRRVIKTGTKRNSHYIKVSPKVKEMRKLKRQELRDKR